MSYNTVPEMGEDEANVDQAPSELDPVRAPTLLDRTPGQDCSPGVNLTWGFRSMIPGLGVGVFEKIL